MTAERFQQIEKQGGIVDLSDRAKFRLTGADRVRYLNGQVTNDVRLASSTSALYACVTDVKGRIAGDIFIHAAINEEALLLDAEPALREVLGPRLERYIIADDVMLEDVTDEWRLWHVFGAAAENLEQPAESGKRGLKTERFGLPGFDLWVNPADAGPAAPVPPLTKDEAETLRILRGIPRFPQELNADAFPPEARLDERAMSYTKGCYIGQEVLSRIRTTGKMPRALVRWQGASGAIVAAGETLFVAEDGGAAQKAGVITSAAWHPVLERFVGLAYLKQGFADVDSELLVGGDTPRIETKVNLLPFSL